MFLESKKGRLQQRTRRLNSGGFSIPLSLSSDEQKRLAIWHLHLTESSFGHPMKSHHIIRCNPVFELSMDLALKRASKHQSHSKHIGNDFCLAIETLRFKGGEKPFDETHKWNRVVLHAICHFSVQSMSQLMKERIFYGVPILLANERKLSDILLNSSMYIIVYCTKTIKVSVLGINDRNNGSSSKDQIAEVILFIQIIKNVRNSLFRNQLSVSLTEIFQLLF